MPIMFGWNGSQTVFMGTIANCGGSSGPQLQCTTFSCHTAIPAFPK